MSGIRRAGGGGGGGQLGINRGGSGKFKAKGGSGPKGGSGNFKAKGGSSGGRRMPPGIAKKYQDGWDGNRTNGGGLLGFVGNLVGGLFGGNRNTQNAQQGIQPQSVMNDTFSSVPTTVANGSKYVSAPPQLDPAAPQQGKSALNLQHVDQYNPAGKDAAYNGDMNCGPALLASIAKARGQTDGLTDAQLINKLGAAAGTDGTGTSGNGMIAGLQELGMNTTAQPGADLNWINNQLAQGHTVIANGDFYSVPSREDPTKQAGHYISITEVNGGMYKVVDPADQNVSTMTAQQLQNFIAAHPEGGFSIATW